ncbi:MAG: prenyltransferase/squalene oxidase repeat-containing protein [Phycisphaerae bacterium]
MGAGYAAHADADAPGPARGDTSAALPPNLRRDVQAAIDRGFDYLKAAEDKSGGWTPRYGASITAIVGQAFAQDDHYGPKHPLVLRARQRVLASRQNDGGLYSPRVNIANYQTAVALMFLASLDDPQLAPTVRDAQAFLARLQYDDGEHRGPESAWYGGAGYTSTKRPDLSNTQMMLDALHQSGLSASDPVFQRAAAFVARCQNLAATNDQPFARAGPNDGGFIYTPVSGGDSKADELGELFRGGHRSYGTMTYSGLKSLLYAQVERRDPRVQAAYMWIRNNYTLDANANMPARRSREGLYYYYHVFAKALAAWGEPVIVDTRGRVHNWRLELCRKLLALQRSDGSWVNDADRWNEGDANYVTALAILSLQAATGR